MTSESCFTAARRRRGQCSVDFTSQHQARNSLPSLANLFKLVLHQNRRVEIGGFRVTPSLTKHKTVGDDRDELEENLTESVKLETTAIQVPSCFKLPSRMMAREQSPPPGRDRVRLTWSLSNLNDCSGSESESTRFTPTGKFCSTAVRPPQSALCAQLESS